MAGRPPIVSKDPPLPSLKMRSLSGHERFGSRWKQKTPFSFRSTGLKRAKGLEPSTSSVGNNLFARPKSRNSAKIPGILDTLANISSRRMTLKCDELRHWLRRFRRDVDDRRVIRREILP